MHLAKRSTKDNFLNETVSFFIITGWPNHKRFSRPSPHCLRTGSSLDLLSEVTFAGLCMGRGGKTAVYCIFTNGCIGRRWISRYLFEQKTNDHPPTQWGALEITFSRGQNLTTFSFLPFHFFYFPLYAFCSVRTLFRLPPSDTIFQPITRQQKIIYSLLKTSTRCRTATSFPRFLPLESESPMVDPFFFWHRGDHKLFHFRDKLMPLFTSL